MSSITKGICSFCNSEGLKRADQSDGLPGPVYVCGMCWELLKKPETGLPFIRGNLLASLRNERGTSRTDLEKNVNSFMGKISVWKLKN